MSKAFTREDEGAGFEAPPPMARRSAARLTAYGARIARERLAELERTHRTHDEEVGELERSRLRELLDGAAIVDPSRAERVALGARVRARSDVGGVRTAIIVTPDEVGLVPSAISAASPLAQALLGAKVGETVEIELPRGPEELTVLSIDWPV